MNYIHVFGIEHTYGSLWATPHNLCAVLPMKNFSEKFLVVSNLKN